MDARVIVMVVLAGCGPTAPRSKVASGGETGLRPTLEPTLVFLPGTGPVAVGTPIYAVVAWDSNCLYGTRLCSEIPQRIEARCESDACIGTGQGHAFDVTPTKPGSLRGTATLRATNGSYRKTFPLSIEAVIPDRVSATCARRDGATSVTVELAHRGTRVRASAPRLAANERPCEYEPTIDHGWPEPPKQSFNYTCPTQDAQLQLVIEGPAGKLTSSCRI